jgi:choline dehydrogenase
MTYIRAQKAQIDAWEDLGNLGWNWDALLPYYKKAEHFHVPSLNQSVAGASFNAEDHGTHGPVHVGFPPNLDAGPFYTTARETFARLGQPFNKDVNGGDVHGFDVFPLTCVPGLGIRSDAAHAYYWPIADRPNLKVLRGTATRILWRDVEAVARGIEYVTPNGSRLEVTATKEVVLSAGALRTPALLELSGVGNPQYAQSLPPSVYYADYTFRILSRYGIGTKVALPSVGENLQDQPNVLLVSHSKIQVTGLAPYAVFPTMVDLFGAEFDTIAARVKTGLSGWAERVSDASGGAISALALQHLYELQCRLLFEESVPSAELLTTAGGNSLVTVLWPLVPFSRGGVHIASADPLAQPAIDPRFFLVDFDMEATVATMRMAQRFWATEPMTDIVGPAIKPDAGTISPDAPDADWATYLTKTCE